MRLLRVRLTDVRGIATAEARFAPDGVTIVEAPNETGKSTLLEAVDVLLEAKDSSRSQRVRDLQPADRDVPSTIEVELTCGPYHLTCTKTYHRQTATVLTIHAPTRTTLRGAEAHDRLRAILDAEVDPALYAALRYPQGRPLDAVAFGGSDVLAARLDAAAGGGGASDGGALLEQVTEAYLRWYTPTGRPGQLLQAAARELEDAERSHADLVARLDRLQQDVAALERLDERLPALRRQQAEDLAPRLAAATTAVAAIHAARATLAARRADHAGATTDLATARRRLDDRAAHDARVAQLRDQVDAATRELATCEDQRGRVQGAHDEHAAGLQDAADAAAAARRHCDQAQVVVDLLEAEGERDRLAQRAERVLSLTAAAREAAAALAELRFGDGDLAAIREAAQAVRVAEAAQTAGAPHLRLVARRALEVVVDGEVVALRPGEAVDRTVVERLRLAVPELAELDLVAGRSAGRLQAALLTAQQELRDACAAAGVADLAEAEQVAATRQQHLEVVQRRETELARELEGATPEALQAALTAAAARVHGLVEQLADVESHARELPAARATVTAARRDADTTVAALTAARARLTEHATALQASRTAVGVAAATLEAARRELARADEERASHVRDHGEDEVLTAAFAAAERREEETARAVAAATEALAAEDPVAVDQAEADARRELAAIDQRIADLRADQAALQERLRLGGEDGLGELVQHAAERLAQARVDHRRTTRRADAARLLHQELTRARDEAYEAYRAPLRDLITRDARAVFGPSLDVELDEQLRLVGRTLDGITLPWDALSAGAREQLAILAGLAAAQLAGADGVPFVVDDALGFTDPDRLERLGAVLDRTAGAQVIVLTCAADRFRAVRRAQVVQLGDRTTATVPATPAPPTPPTRVAAPLTLTLPGVVSSPGSSTRPEAVRRPRRAQDGGTPRRASRDRARSPADGARGSGARDAATAPVEAAALTLDLGPH
jgi:hypothetical protein